MNVTVDRGKICRLTEMAGDSDEDTALLREMAANAEQFLISFRWCGQILERYFGLGVGRVVAVFGFAIVPASEKADNFIWIVVGDLPPACIEASTNANPAMALEGYIAEMRRWVEAVETGKSVDDLIPVNGAATPKNAEALSRRLKFLEENILSSYRDDLPE